MFDLFRTMELDQPIWQAFRRTKPKSCPTCRQRSTWQQTAAQPDYTIGLQLKAFECGQCQTTVHCIWPKRVHHQITIAFA